MGRTPSESQDKFIVRLPDGMREQLKAASEANNRTMTAELVARLKASFEQDGRSNGTVDERILSLGSELEILRAQIRSLQAWQYELTQATRLTK